jgi:large subunit ribosomal protein L17
MLRNLATSILLKGMTDNQLERQVITTLHKAKAVQGLVDRLITYGKKGDLSARRQAVRFVKDKEAFQGLFDILGDRYKERKGGYTRILKLSSNRHGDNAEMAAIMLVEDEITPRPKKKSRPKKKAAAEKSKAEVKAKPEGADKADTADDTDKAKKTAAGKKTEVKAEKSEEKSKTEVKKKTAKPANAAEAKSEEVKGPPKAKKTAKPDTKAGADTEKKSKKQPAELKKESEPKAKVARKAKPEPPSLD